jgi:hypothetical protein
MRLPGLRNRLASYAAAITIIVEQLSSVPSNTAFVSPTPLVRIRESKQAVSDWHPDELIECRTGDRCVLVLGYSSTGRSEESGWGVN